MKCRRSIFCFVALNGVHLSIDHSQTFNNFEAQLHFLDPRRFPLYHFLSKEICQNQLQMLFGLISQWVAAVWNLEGPFSCYLILIKNHISAIFQSYLLHVNIGRNMFHRCSDQSNAFNKKSHVSKASNYPYFKLRLHHVCSEQTSCKMRYKCAYIM